MGKMEIAPLYVRLKTGEITRIDLDPEGHPEPITWAEATACKLSPELVITEEELSRQLGENVEHAYGIYKPIVDALRLHGSLTLRQISQITGRPLRKEREYVKKLYGANLLTREGNIYTITEKNTKGISTIFGVIL